MELRVVKEGSIKEWISVFVSHSLHVSSSLYEVYISLYPSLNEGLLLGSKVDVRVVKEGSIKEGSSDTTPDSGIRSEQVGHGSPFVILISVFLEQKRHYIFHCRIHMSKFSESGFAFC